MDSYELGGIPPIDSLFFTTYDACLLLRIYHSDGFMHGVEDADKEES